MATVTVSTDVSLGAYSDQVADQLVADGSYDARVANALIDLQTQVLADLTALEAGSSIAAATAVANGTVRLAGDLAGTGGTAAAPRVSGVNSATVPAAGALTTGNVLQVTGASALGYAAVNLAGGANFVTGVLPSANLFGATAGAPGAVQLAGDFAGSGSAAATPRVGAINSSTVPAGGALTTGNVLQVSGASALSYAALNLAGGADYVTGVLPSANVSVQAGSVRTARGVVYSNVADLGAFTVASDDGITYVETDRVLLTLQTTATQNGLYVVGVVGGGTAALTRVADMAAAAVMPNGLVVEVSEGTHYEGSSWKAMSTQAGGWTVGTHDPVFYPRLFKQTVTLSAGTYKIGFGSTATPDEPLFLWSTTTSMVNITRDTAAGTLTGTVMYACPVTTRVAGLPGVANVVINSVVEAGTLQNQDTSTLSVLITNW